jgi:hypothetical protein
MAQIDRSGYRYTCFIYNQITIQITIINISAVTAFIPVIFLTLR